MMYWSESFVCFVHGSSLRFFLFYFSDYLYMFSCQAPDIYKLTISQRQPSLTGKGDVNIDNSYALKMKSFVNKIFRKIEKRTLNQKKSLKLLQSQGSKFGTSTQTWSPRFLNVILKLKYFGFQIRSDCQIFGTWWSIRRIDHHFLVLRN